MSELTREDILNADESEIADILVECYRSYKVYCKALLPDLFERNFSSKIHDPIFELLDDTSLKKVAIAAPRGIGKTTIVSTAVPSRSILFRDRKHIVPISCSATKAIQEGENLKWTLTTNPLIKKLFGNMRSRTFSKEHWVADNVDSSHTDEVPTGVMPRGALQQVRGLRYKMYRPDLIVADDLEDPNLMDNSELRNEKKKWFYADVMKSVDWPSDWRVIVLGTILHEDSLLVNLLDEQSWESIQLSICNSQFVSNWPEFMSDEEIQADIEEHKRQGILDVWYREMMNLPVPMDESGFSSEMFVYYDEEDPEFLKIKDNMETVVIYDPAKTTKSTSADTAIVGVGLDLMNSRLYFRDCVAERLHPEQQYDEVFRMAERLGARTIGLEVTSLNEFITYPFRNEMSRRGLNYEVIELKPRGGGAGRRGSESKAERVGSLLPMYRQGQVLHNKDKRVSGQLETQLLAFPKSKKWDVMDALGYVVQMLDMGLRFFTPEYDGEDSADYIEKEYEEILALDEQEEPLGEWRWVR